MDFEEFLEKKQAFVKNNNFRLYLGRDRCLVRCVSVEDLGLFFWERGGKDFVNKTHSEIRGCKWKDLIYESKYCLENRHGNKADSVMARDFLDALFCLGDGKIRELIKGLV